MENESVDPSPAEAAASLATAEAARSRLAQGVVMPSWFFPSIGVAIAAQIGTAAVGIGVGTSRAVWALIAGIVFFGLVVGVQLVRFRRLNGVWLGGLADRVAFGTGAVTSTAYAGAAVVAIWAGSGHRWWLVALAALAGGYAYAWLGRRWVRAYRADPVAHAGGESAVWLAAAGLTALAGLALLVLER